MIQDLEDEDDPDMIQDLEDEDDPDGHVRYRWLVQQRLFFDSLDCCSAHSELELSLWFAILTGTAIMYADMLDDLAKAVLRVAQIVGPGGDLVLGERAAVLGGKLGSSSVRVPHTAPR